MTKKQKPTKSKKAISKPSGRKFFTVKEDLEIYNVLKDSDGVAVSTISKQISDSIHRSFEAVRDRIKRYITKLSDKDVKRLIQASKSTPNFYLHFKQSNDPNKQIDKILAAPPSLQNQHLIRKPRVGKSKLPRVRVAKGKEGKKVVLPDTKLEWVKEKLENKDAFFRIDFTVQFIVDLLNAVMEVEKVDLKSVQEYVDGVKTNQSLGDILRHFKVLKNN